VETADDGQLRWVESGISQHDGIFIGYFHSPCVRRPSLFLSYDGWRRGPGTSLNILVRGANIVEGRTGWMEECRCLALYVSMSTTVVNSEAKRSLRYIQDLRH